MDPLHRAAMSPTAMSRLRAASYLTKICATIWEDDVVGDIEQLRAALKRAMAFGHSGVVAAPIGRDECVEGARFGDVGRVLTGSERSLGGRHDPAFQIIDEWARSSPGTVLAEARTLS
jgi:hypothetical protein